MVDHAPQQPEADAAPPRFVVCGDNPLTLRLVIELTVRHHAAVTVILPSRAANLGPSLAAQPGVEIVEAPRPSAEAFERAGLRTAAALALVAQDDAGNLDAALIAKEINRNLRVVVRMFNQNLAERISGRLEHIVLSESSIAAPGFVTAALGESTPTSIEVAGHTLVAARRSEVAPGGTVVRGLAVVPDTEDGPDEPDVLPEDEWSANLVLADVPPVAAEHRPRRPRRHPLRVLATFVGRRLAVAFAAVATLLVVSAVLYRAIAHHGWLESLYITVLTTLGGADPDPGRPWAEQVLQTVLVVLSVAIVPIMTAAVVEAVVRTRLAAGGPTGPMNGHFVVVGLGNVGTRVITDLHERGFDVVAVDHRSQARGVQVARDLGIPVIVGDATQEGVLRAAGVQTCRALLVLTTDDVRNLEAALLGRSINEPLRVVLRLFDGEFAARVEDAFGLGTSRSVAHLAAPTFAAAMMGREVLGTIAIHRRVLLVAELPVAAGSELEGELFTEVNRPGQARLLAILTGRGAQMLWNPHQGRKLVHTDHILVACTRTGLGELVARCAPAAVRPPAITPLDLDQMPPTHAFRPKPRRPESPAV